MNKSCRSLICNPSKIVYIPDKLRIFFRPKLHFGMFWKSQTRKPNVNSILFSRLHVRKSTSFSTLLIDLHIFKKSSMTPDLDHTGQWFSYWQLETRAGQAHISPVILWYTTSGDTSPARQVGWYVANIKLKGLTLITLRANTWILTILKTLESTLGAKNNFLSRNYQEFDASNMWILWKMRLGKCEFCKN